MPNDAAYLRQKAAAAYLGMSVRYFREHVTTRPMEWPGRGTKPVLVYRRADLDAWAEAANTAAPARRGRKSA